jgi:tetratricopeptide (TPR) repeat protein
VDRSPDGLDSPFEIIQRMQWLGASAMDEVTLGQLERHIPEVIARYEIVGPAHFAPDLVSQRRWLHAVMREHHPPRRLTRLYAAASQMSGILASVALDLRSFATARAYAVEAFHLAHLLADPDLTAWVRATQSLIEYYDGCYAESLAHARDGLRISPRGPQSIRLAANGEARALARMGDRQGVDFAIGRALELLYTLPAAVDTSASLTLGPYCAARVAGNAATAYLILGEPHQVLHHGAQALRVFDEIGMQGPRALTRFDLATSLVQGDTADPDRAADLALEALSIEGAVGFASVIQRAEEFIAAASGLNAVPAIRDVSARVRELTARSPLPELEGPST